MDQRKALIEALTVCMGKKESDICMVPSGKLMKMLDASAMDYFMDLRYGNTGGN